MSANQQFTLGCIGLFLIACFSCAVIVLATYVVSPVPTVVEQYPTVVTPRPTEIVIEPTPGWEGDNFGPELHLPGRVVGPAIAELKGNAGYCALVKVNSGETLNWTGGGSYWVAGSLKAIEDRWPGHLQEFIAKAGNSDCKIFLHSYDVQ